MNLNFDDLTQTEKTKLDTFLKEYNDDETKVSLADKYNNLCRIAWNIYEKKP